MRWNGVGRVGVVLWACLVVAPVCWASEGSSSGVGDDQAGATAPADDADVLAGPRAEEADVPGSSGVFAPSMDGRGMRGGGDARTDRWLQRIIRGLMREAPSEELAVSAEQREAIGAAMRGHEERVRVYREAHAEEIRELREAAGIGSEDELRRRNRAEGAEGATPSPEAQAATQRLREINRGTPTTDRLRGEIWAVLSDAQRAHVEAELERLREEAEAGAGDAMMMGDGDAMAPARGRRGHDAGGAATGTGDERLDAFVERVMALPEAQRERVLRRLTQMLERFEQAERESRRRAQPPSMDGVDVPGEGRRGRGANRDADAPGRGG
ncbi:MAG: hypothetical protein Tsb0013_24700 [Phycisphaerales bacterium]